MTKFVGVSKTARRKTTFSETAADRRLALAMHSVNGEPIAQAEEAAGAAEVRVAPRTRVAFLLARDGAAFGAGPVVVQLFDDEAPAGAQAFRLMVLAEGSRLNALQPGVRADFQAAAQCSLQREEVSVSLDSPGLVSVCSSGFSLSLRAPPRGQQVVGLLTSGLQTLTDLCSIHCGEGGAPTSNVLVCAACTLLNGASDGAELALALSHEDKAAQAARAVEQRSETVAQTRTRLGAESRAQRQSVSAAVELALQQSKKPRLAPAAQSVKGMMFAELLGPDSEDEPETD